MERVRQTLGTLLTAQHVVDLPPGEGKRDVVARLGRIACRAAGVSAAREPDVLTALWDRETILSTGIGLGIAVPHVRHAEVAAETMVVGRSMTGLAYEAIDGKPVHAVFCILMPSGDHRRHVEVLGSIAAALKDPVRRSTIFSAPDAVSFVERLLG